MKAVTPDRCGSLFVLYFTGYFTVQHQKTTVQPKKRALRRKCAIIKMLSLPDRREHLV